MFVTDGVTSGDEVQMEYFRTELGGRLSRELLYVWYLNNVHIIN